MRHQITLLTRQKNIVSIKVSIQIPFEKGWIERVRLYMIMFEKNDMYEMKHVKNEDNVSCFEVTVSLQNNAKCQYYFSYETNDKFQYYKKIDRTGDKSITKEEYWSWKIPACFEMLECTEETTISPICKDGYIKRNQTMPVRPIRERWYEAPVIGFLQKAKIDVTDKEKNLDYIECLGVDIIYL